ncbi:MAG: cystathionine gamma-synthase, partial [Actinobacteria bacterium]
MNSGDLDTWLAQAGREIDEASGGIVPPIQPSVTFARDGDNQLLGEFIYARNGNPVDAHLERVLAALESGTGAAVFASG